MNKLLDYRESIDNIDMAILYLLNERMKIVKKVGKYKEKNRIPPLDLKRWSKVISSKKAKAKEFNLNEDFVEKIYNIIHKYSLKVESSK